MSIIKFPTHVQVFVKLIYSSCSGMFTTLQLLQVNYLQKCIFRYMINQNTIFFCHLPEIKWTVHKNLERKIQPVNKKLKLNIWCDKWFTYGLKRDLCSSSNYG